MSFFDEDVFFADDIKKTEAEKENAFSMPSGASNDAAAGSLLAAKERRRSGKIKMITSTVVITTVLIAGMAMLTVLIKGRGWAANLILGGKNIEFTLPVAKYPDVDIAGRGVYCSQASGHAFESAVELRKCIFKGKAAQRAHVCPEAA